MAHHSMYRVYERVANKSRVLDNVIVDAAFCKHQQATVKVTFACVFTFDITI